MNRERERQTDRQTDREKGGPKRKSQADIQTQTDGVRETEN